VKIVAAKIICENPSMHPERRRKFGTCFFKRCIHFYASIMGGREKNELAGGAFLDNLF